MPWLISERNVGDGEVQESMGECVLCVPSCDCAGWGMEGGEKKIEERKLRIVSCGREELQGRGREGCACMRLTLGLDWCKSKMLGDIFGAPL